MSSTRPSLDFYFAAVSPWVYLGQAQLLSILERQQADVRLHAVDPSYLGEHGFLALPQRPAARRDYRIWELKRWRDQLGVPLNLQPKFFPTPAASATGMVLAAQDEVSPRAALAFLARIGRAVWADELDIADSDVLLTLAHECGLDGPALLAAAPGRAGQFAESSERARQLGVFGVPWYVVAGEPFWGQDRLDFVERALERQSRKPLAGPLAGAVAGAVTAPVAGLVAGAE